MKLEATKKWDLLTSEGVAIQLPSPWSLPADATVMVSLSKGTVDAYAYIRRGADGSRFWDELDEEGREKAVGSTRTLPMRVDPSAVEAFVSSAMKEDAKKAIGLVARALPNLTFQELALILEGAAEFIEVDGGMMVKRKGE